ncbi:MAG: LCP family protein [Streptococcaceae bacterium]|jgi:LCP family protein required for cell wall assembly|nr:LCP family protein [Streptococcaceae bacterium]
MKLWQKTLLMLFALLALSAGTIFAYAATIWGTTKTTLGKTYTSVGKAGAETLKATEPLTILLMGVDTGDVSRGGNDSWAGNADTNIVLTLNPKTNTSTMVSLERDTMTNILNESGEVTSTQKLNAAYPFGYNANGMTGAASWSLNTMADQVGINLNNFVAINFNGLVNLVNDVGGIDVINDSQGIDALQGTSSGDMITLPTGEEVPSGTLYISDTDPATAYVEYKGEGVVQTINGEQALVFARDRHTLSNGDYGRIAHQREVIAALMKKMLNMNNISQYQKFLNDASADIKTNIQVNTSNLQSLLAYRSCFKKIVSVQFQGLPYTNPSDSGSYQLMAEQTLLAMQNLMRKSVGQPTIDALNSDVVTYESLIGYEPDSYFLPSVTITEDGKQTVQGVDPSGDLVKITAKNAGSYVSTKGDAVQVEGGSEDSSTESSSSSSQ